VYGLAVGMTRNPEDAADMAQEAFIKAYDKLDQYKPEYSFRSWVLRICANQTKNLFRKRTRVRRAEERRLMESVVLESSIPPDFGALEEALGKLPAKFNAPLRLRYMEELSYNEISTILGIGVSAAKMRVARAKQQLAELLGP
jgi:RNA polymerase sigma-70 factor (ECF subfamily)